MEPLILVDVLDAHGNLASRQRLALRPGGPAITVGRALENDVIVVDPYAAPVHAELVLDADGTLRVTDLSQVNGIIVGGERLRGARLLALPDGLVRLGHSTLHVRSAAEAALPELPDRDLRLIRRLEYAIAIFGALLGLAFAFLQAWVAAPDNWPLVFFKHVAIGAVLAGLFLAVWFLLGRVRRARTRLATHAAILLSAIAGCLWLGWLTDLAVFMTGLPSLRPIGVLLQLTVVVVALYLHIRKVRWLSAPWAVIAAAGIPAVVLGGYLWYERQERVNNVNHLPPFVQMFPASWSHQSGESIGVFLDSALVLRDEADQKRAEADK